MAKLRPAEALRNELISFSHAKVDNKFPVKTILNIFLFMAEEAFVYKGSGRKKNLHL
jgi:hypothetical protein